LEEARKLAAKEGTTVRELVEQGLRRVVAERKPQIEISAAFPRSRPEIHSSVDQRYVDTVNSKG
jgi:hypothetical protein